MTGDVRRRSLLLFHPGPETVHGLQVLRQHLLEVGFAGAHKLLVSPRRYGSDVDVVRAGTPLADEGLSLVCRGGTEHLSLVECLTLGRPVIEASLRHKERAVARSLVEAGLLLQRDGWLRLGPVQLVTVQGMPLLIDARLHFPAQDVHRVYIGMDSMMLLHYLQSSRCSATGRALDLGTGTGVVAMQVARQAGRVVGTDIEEEALRLAGWNRVLNAREDRVELRREPYATTIARGERYDLVTFNPPFVPLPPAVDGPLFARGGGRDGLDELRLLVSGLGDLLCPGGTAFGVADLPGDEGGPWFLDELQSLCRAGGLCAEVYLDHRVDHRIDRSVLRSVAAWAARVSGEEPEVLFQRVRSHFLDELGATCNYLTTMVLRLGSGRAWMRAFARFGWPRHTGAWGGRPPGRVSGGP